MQATITQTTILEGGTKKRALGIIFPAMTALTTNRVSDREQGHLAGVNAALAGLMSALGPLLAGLMYDRVAPGAPYWANALVLIVTSVLMLGVRAPRRVEMSPKSA